MALHQTYALNYLGFHVPPSEGIVQPWQKSGNYPPFVHLVIAGFFWIFHPGPHIAALANIPATLILFWAIYELARDLAGPQAGRWACVLAALTPYMIWMSRETILDYWLSAWFAAALVVLRKNQDFRSRPLSLFLGAILGLGLLTKWFFAGLIIIPVAYVFIRHQTWKEPARCMHFLEAIIAAGIVAGPWYIPNIPRLIQYFGENAKIGAREGEPPVLSFQSLIYYVRLLEGYQLFGVLFGLLLLACFFCWRKKLLSDWKFLAVSLIGAWLFVTALRTKDPRFTMPLLGPLAVITGAWIQSWRKTSINAAVKGTLAALLCFQAYAANFGIRWLPERVVILRGYQGSYRWDWNLYLQNYFGILGKPRKEDWMQDRILRKLAVDSEQRRTEPSLALVPDLPHFNEGNFCLYARIRGLKAHVVHLQSGGRGLASFDGYNYVLMTERDQGVDWTTGASAELNKTIVDSPEIFRLVELYTLPTGDCARLYFIQRTRQDRTANPSGLPVSGSVPPCYHCAHV